MRVRPHLGQVALTARADDIGHVHAGGLHKRVHQLQHAHGVAGAQIEGLRARVLHGIVDGLEMALGQIDDMQIVAAAGAVRCGIVVAEDRQLVQLTGRHAGDIGHEVVRDTVRVIAEQAGGMAADGVEVAQQHGREARRCGAVVAQDLLDHDLRPAVGVCCDIGGHRLDIGDGVVRAIDRRGGREHEARAARLRHFLEQGQRGIQIVAVIGQRDMAALADRLEARKMHDGIDAVRREDLMQDGAVLRIRLIERRTLSRDGLDLVDDRTGRIGQVVQNDDVVARLKQLDAGVAADEARAAGYQNFHNDPS